MSRSWAVHERSIGCGQFFDDAEFSSDAIESAFESLAVSVGRAAQLRRHVGPGLAEAAPFGKQLLFGCQSPADFANSSLPATNSLGDSSAVATS